MQRNDSVLLTGMNSGSVGKLERTQQKERIRKDIKLKDKQTLLPVIDPIIKMIEKERDDVAVDLLRMVDNHEKEEDVRAKLLAAKLYRDSMVNLKNRINTLMRTEAKNEQAK